MSLLVVRPGLLTTVQDRGRRGWAHLGVGRSGAADGASLQLANRVVGNPELPPPHPGAPAPQMQRTPGPGAAGLEVLGGGLVLEATADHVVAVAGARCGVSVGARAEGPHVALRLRAGERLALGPPTAGLRAYVAVAGGVDVRAVLGSRSWDSLGELGPAPLRVGDVLPVGATAGEPLWEPVPVRQRGAEVRVVLGPREDWLTHPADLLTTWTVLPSSDRTGIRLGGPVLRRRPGELPSEGVVPGSVQVPPDGRPIVLGPDAGVTGGYPVVAVVVAADLDVLGQLAPGGSLRLTTSR